MMIVSIDIKIIALELELNFVQYVDVFLNMFK
jgi:hypothetical protein